MQQEEITIVNNEKSNPDFVTPRRAHRERRRNGGGHGAARGSGGQRQFCRFEVD
jgi:hypothetical protein